MTAWTRLIHVGYTHGWPGHVKTRSTSSGPSCSIPPWVAWLRENTWFKFGATMLGIPLGVLDMFKHVVLARATMLDLPLGGLDRQTHVGPALGNH
eukprot:8109305-Pyramimonas_sp.AAC.1